MKCLRNENGQALVEFAIILPILLILIMGIVQFGLVLNAYITIENASREGARRGIIGITDAEIKNLIIATSPSLEEKNITLEITPNEGSRKSGDTIKVKIEYNYNLSVPIISNLFNKTITLKSQTSMRIE